MKKMNIIWPAVFSLLATALSGCGGGGGASNGGASASSSQAPASGTYAWLITGQGLETASTYGLALIHPATPEITHEIEPITASITDVAVISSGTVDVTTATVRNIEPHALLYIVNGDVHRIPLRANGTAPISGLTKALINDACTFLIHANDFAEPDNSRYIVSSKGSDRQCGTYDDGQMEITLDASGRIRHQAPSIRINGLLREPATLAPSYWILSNGVQAWNPAALHVMRMNSAPPLGRVVIGTHNAAVVEYDNQLTVLRHDGWPNITETVLNRALTLGSGWQAIGFDPANFYVYRNDTTNATSTWSLLKITRTAPVATLLATGPGQIGAASMGTNLLYLTVRGTTTNTLLSIEKNGQGGTTTLESTPPSTFSSVRTSKNAVHQLWRLSGIGTATPSSTIEMLDESGNKPYAANSGFPLLFQPPSSLNFNISENRTRFLFTAGFTPSQGVADAPLLAYDTDNHAITTLGMLPGANTFGQATVFANVTSSTNNFMAGFAGRIQAGVLQPDTLMIFTFDINSQGSLR